MVNIFVTYRCNFSCPYCFAADMRGEFPHDMEEGAYTKLLQWLVQSGQHSAAFIGGEPTLHPRLPEMIQAAKNAGISPVLFTNGLFSSDLISRLSESVANFVVNYNDPALYSESQSERLHENLALLKEQGAKITFSKNFTVNHCAFDYLLAGAERYGVNTVRYDISRPSHDGDNDHLAWEDYRNMLALVVNFVQACEERDIRTGLDCCVRFCDLPAEDRRFLERVSMKLTGVCHPSIDIHPDLSASYCLPMRHVRVDDVTTFADNMAVMRWFSDSVRPVRYEGVGAECSDCKDFKRTCQGGCLALKKHTSSQIPVLHETGQRMHS